MDNNKITLAEIQEKLMEYEKELSAIAHFVVVLKAEIEAKDEEEYYVPETVSLEVLLKKMITPLFCDVAHMARQIK